MKLPRIAWHPSYVHPVPENHRFPMVKYELIRTQLIREGVADESQFFSPGLLDLSHTKGVHESEYVMDYANLNLSKRQQRISGFEHSKQLVDRELRLCQGTIECSLHALKDGISLNIAGGTHHAFPDRGEGFCMLNDQAIAANYLLSNGLAKNILILDLDVHQGNGTAKIFESEPQVTTVSVHGKENYPYRKERSDIDLEISSGSNDSEYLDELNTLLVKLVGRKDAFDFIFYQSGVDILESDKLGKLNVSLDGIKKRDQMVLDFKDQLDAPLVACMGGGYGENLAAIVDAHVSFFKEIAARYS